MGGPQHYCPAWLYMCMCVWREKEVGSCWYYPTCYLAPDWQTTGDRAPSTGLRATVVHLIGNKRFFPSLSLLFHRFLHFHALFEALKDCVICSKKLGSSYPGTSLLSLPDQKSHLASAVSCNVDVPLTRDHNGSSRSPRESSHSPSILQPNPSLFSHSLPLPSPPPPPLLPFQSWQQMVF